MPPSDAGRAALLAALLGTLVCLAAPARVMAADCAVPMPAGLPCPSQPWETVDLEHRDRMARLQRLSAGRGGFTFVEDRISAAEHGLKDFPAEIPVLRVIADQDVFFDSGSDSLRAEAYGVLDAIAGSLKKEPPDVVLFVSGHTDAQGSEADNMSLGLARAHEVASGLLRRGIYQSSIFRVSFGEHLPIASNATAASRARNRRVEFLFGARPEALVAEIRKQSGPCIAASDAGTGDAGATTRANGDCRRRIGFIVERMTVEPAYAEQIVDLEERTDSIELDRTKTAVEKAVERQEVELERARIPVEISREKIVVELDR